MSFFDYFRPKRHTQDEEDEESYPAEKTAPGVRSIRDLWQIENKQPAAPIEGAVPTDIYSTQRPNGVPHRKNPRRRTRLGGGEFNPPF